MVATKRQSSPKDGPRENVARSLIGRALAIRRQYQHPPMCRGALGELLSERLSRQLPYRLKPVSYRIGAYNKVFACDWLDRDTVVMATKCNNLLRLSLLDSSVARIPLLRLPGQPRPPWPIPGFGSEGGIHALEVNPSGTFMVTGALADGDLGVYELPGLRPYALLHGAHSDWVFDAAWLDAGTLVSVARDSSLAVWSLPERDGSGISEGGFSVAEPRYRRCLHDLYGQPGAKLRSVDVGRCGGLAVLSLSCFLHFYSPERLDTPVSCVELGHFESSLAKETVCVRASPDPFCFFSCCVDQVSLYDARMKSAVYSLESTDRIQGVRSLACNGPILSYGTGVGNVYFYDCRSRRHLHKHLQLPRLAAVTPDGAPLLFRDHNYLAQASGTNAEYAVYSHRYDADRVRIFTAGGPLATTYWGNLAVLHS